ncbi:chaetoglobosin A biosynthesis cluster protein C-like [Coccinella septempunctata]|uniref:chaetoglobosin A biosynthesis cluster protein C-like n=1 Tax=Coccinella septempunctata TaxID=41139 RepID=UPI001D070C0E|nr:chaetoglobosin A biosynthesis cluster protein C-like [Coccinella septempunctata]
MPRHYKRKTETKYKIEDLRHALEELRNKKLTLSQAVIKYHVPKTTLLKQLKQNEFKIPKKGRSAVFNKEQEIQLEKYILDCCKSFYGVTPNSLRRIAFRFAEANKLKHSFNKESQLAGKDWYYGFMSRHPSISLRIPEATSLNRITAFNAAEVNLFFEHLKTIQTKHNIPGHRIFNIDETGISTVQKNYKILAPKGLEQIAKATSGERGVPTTVVCAVSATGIYVPPMFIFKRKRMNQLLTKGGNSVIIVTVSESGWINESIFQDY